MRTVLVNIAASIFIVSVFLSIINAQDFTPTLPPLPSNTSSIINDTTSVANMLKVCDAAALNSSLLQQCEDILVKSVKQSVDIYTNTLAENFRFCIADPIRERDAAFDFQGNLSFLSKCFDKTEGLILQYICSGPEIKLYLDSMPALIKGTANVAASATLSGPNCNPSSWTQGCEAGWSKSLSQILTDPSQLYANNTSIPLRTNVQDIPCCEGFFCPRGLGCMIPCPLGAQCTDGNLSGGLCEPYNYPLTPGGNYSCGGANLWASLSVSKGIFCPAGFYCPSSTDIHTCNKGHFCRQGSTAQSQCFRLANCNELSTTQHIQSYGIMLIVGMTLILLVIYNCANKIRHIRRKRKEKTREKAIKQVKENLSAAKKFKSAATMVKRFGRTVSGFPKSRTIDRLELHNSSRTHSERANPRVGSERNSQELQNIGECSQGNFTLHVEIDEDLYEAPVIPEGLANSRNVNLRTRSQILMYAYDQIEKEKAIENKDLKILQHERSCNRLKIEITFQDLSLFLKGSGKKILSNVTGKLSPGRVTAIMGPSGAGKTTFLNALAGKLYNSYTSGIILINGKPDPIKCYRKIIGFVPQDDIVHGDLTVEENLWFSARYRLPVDMAKPDKVLVVERIIDALGLQQIRNSKVGTVERRGISGGQRKRVNVGLEMVMEPSLLILDEPTSGLDSTSSFLVLRALRREAQAGVNVGVVLHQPSYGLFRMFDDVMFLAKGGRTVYLGPVDDVEDYFASMGINVPERINPPDHFMDVLEGITKASEQKFDSAILPIKWIEYKGYAILEDLQASYHENNIPIESSRQHPPQSSRNHITETSFVQEILKEFGNFTGNNWDEFKSTFTKYEDLSNRVTPGFFAQFKTIISRIALQRVREARVQMQDFLLLLICGACLGVIVPSKDSDLGSNNYPYIVIALSLLCMIASLRTFTNDKLQYWRESASGINRVAYFLAKDTVDHFNTAIKPVFFLSMVYFFNNPRSTFIENYIVTLALVYCVTGIAYIFAVTMQSGPAQLWSVLLPVIFTLIATQKDVPRSLKFIQYADYAKWAIEAYIISNVKRYTGVWLITRCALLYSTDYNIRNWPRCLAILFLMGFIARFIALLCLILCNRKRQR